MNNNLKTKQVPKPRWRKVKADAWSPLEPRIELMENQRWYGTVTPGLHGSYEYYSYTVRGVAASKNEAKAILESAAAST